MPSSPTERSLAHLRKQGARIQVVEHWNGYARRRVDLFGCIDLLALDGGPGVLGVQTTTAANMAARFTKIRTSCGDVMRAWLSAGNRLVIHGWAKRGPRGQRKVWTVTERPIALEDL